jgi:hypothetical protein
MHRCYLIYSGTSLDERYGENKNIRALRKLCRAYIPPEYIRQRKWVMTEPWGLFYLHPEHGSIFLSLHGNCVKLSFRLGYRVEDVNTTSRYCDWCELPSCHWV